MLAGPLVECGQPPTAQQIGLVTLTLIPISGLPLQLRPQSQRSPVGLDRLAQRRPQPQQRLVRDINGGLPAFAADLVPRILIADQQPGINKSIDHHQLLITENAALHPPASQLTFRT